MTGGGFRQGPNASVGLWTAGVGAARIAAAMAPLRLRMLGPLLWFWLLIGPPDRGDQAVWVIQGGYESRASCEAFREWSPNAHSLMCVDARRAAWSFEPGPSQAASRP
jgi:hypothetical protein